MPQRATAQFWKAAIGSSPEEKNIGIAQPESHAVGRTPAQVSNIMHYGTANVTLEASQMDLPDAGEKTYSIGYTPTFSIARGNLLSIISLTRVEGVKTDPGTYALIFRSASSYSILSLTTGKVIRPLGQYTSGVPIIMGGTGLRITLTDTATSADLRPETGDSILVYPGVVLPPERGPF